MNGKVWMVGAGPGDPELITVRGRDALESAGVVVYDSSVNVDYLECAPESAEVVNAGQVPFQAKGDGSVERLLIARANAGKSVVRLLGGDPFVLGPGVREALALAAAGVPFEIVPGVTSTVAAPAYAGIPILHPELAHSYAVLNGDQLETGAGSTVDWRRLALAVDTLVLVEGVTNLPAVTGRLIENGRASSTPVAVIRWGAHAHQMTIVSTLGDIAEEVAAAGLRPPAITVIGDVVRLRERLRWYDQRPLFGRRVLLARTRRGASEIKRQLQAEGAEVIDLPARESTDLVAPAIINRVIDALTDGQYGWIIFSSPRAVEMLFRRLAGRGRDARVLHDTRIVATGAGTVDTLAQHGILADLQIDEPTPEAILAGLRGQNLARRRVLLPRAEESQIDLLTGLRRAGAEVEDVPLAVAGTPKRRDTAALDRLLRREIDIVVFPASAAVASLIALLDGDLAPLRGVTIACIGAITAEAARDAGLRVDALAEPATPAGLARSLSARLGATELASGGRGRA